jgi:hypothetical protein
VRRRSRFTGEAPAGRGVRAGRPDMVPRMFWPLAAGFIAFVLLSLLLGWILDTSRSDGDSGHH